MTVNIDDIRKAGFCVRGARDWFRAHGIDFARFLKEGVADQVLLATGDPLAKRVVELKCNRAADG